MIRWDGGGDGVAENFKFNRPNFAFIFAFDIIRSVEIVIRDINAKQTTYF